MKLPAPEDIPRLDLGLDKETKEALSAVVANGHDQPFNIFKEAYGGHPPFLVAPEAWMVIYSSDPLLVAMRKLETAGFVEIDKVTAIATLTSVGRRRLIAAA